MQSVFLFHTKKWYHGVKLHVLAMLRPGHFLKMGGTRLFVMIFQEISDVRVNSAQKLLSFFDEMTI